MVLLQVRKECRMFLSCTPSSSIVAIESGSTTIDLNWSALCRTDITKISYFCLNFRKGSQSLLNLIQACSKRNKHTSDYQVVSSNLPNLKVTRSKSQILGKFKNMDSYSALECQNDVSLYWSISLNILLVSSGGITWNLFSGLW